jgi:hypothetical protein
MTTTRARHNHELSTVAEHQMRTWALQMESKQALEREQSAKSARHLVCPYIAVSRESGVDAGEIANAVGAKLGWKVLDRGILDYMAEHYQWSRVALEYVDERTASWFHDTFGKWLDEHLVSQPQYVRRLGQIVVMAAQHESTVFVGRGAQFLLPRERGVSVRLINLKQQRIARIVEREGLSPPAAEKLIDEVDKGRADFVRRYFHRDVTDPHLYDLVINLEHLGRDAAVDLIVNSYQLRFGPSSSGSASKTSHTARR